MADTVLKGSVQIELDGSGLEARLIYKPDENGEEWNREKILAVLEKSHITEGIQNSEIDKLLSAPPSKDGEPVTIVGARGEPMEPPEEEKVEWDGWDVPEEMRSSIEKIVRSAGEPVITQVRVEKIKKKQKVEKKAKLSFLPSKEEIVEVVEKKEIKENIEVDPAVEAWGWLTAGGRIARVLPSKPGKVGKDIYGTPIMPEKELAPAVYPGANIEVRGNDLIAKETGIVRRGGNWVEVIPFAPHAWSLHLSKDQVTCLLDFTPGTPEADVPDAADVHAQAVELGADQATLLDEKELQGLLAEICSNGAEVHDYSISRDEDGSVEITVSEDKLKAFLSLKKGRGNGTPLDLKNVGKVLRESGVKGFKPDKVKQDILAFYRGPEQHQEEYLLAEGTPPEEPQPRKLVFNVQFVPDKERDTLKNRIITAGSAAASGITSTRDFPVDMVDGVGFVARHQTFAYLEEVQKPAAGKDVYGKEIAPADVPEQIVNTLKMSRPTREHLSPESRGSLKKPKRNRSFFSEFGRTGTVKPNSESMKRKCTLS